MKKTDDIEFKIKNIKKELRKESYRVLKKIDQSGKLSLEVFTLVVVLFAVIPLVSEKNSFKIQTIYTEISFEYNYLITIYFLLIFSLLIFSILIGIFNLVKKSKHRNIMKKLDIIELVEQK